MANDSIIDAEIISEEKIPERPKEVRTVSLPQAAMGTAASVANGLDAVGATNAANKVRAGMASAAALGQTVEAAKPAIKAVGDFIDDMKLRGYIKMAPRRRAFSPRSKVKP